MSGTAERALDIFDDLFPFMQNVVEIAAFLTAVIKNRHGRDLCSLF